jgi:hypothetical protein
MALPDEGATRAPITDDWGRDPQVRAMRRVFALMETLQTRLFEKVQISPFDERLGGWRRAALRMFEQEWAEAAGRGVPLGEEGGAKIYLDCVVRVMTKDGVDVSAATREALGI